VRADDGVLDFGLCGIAAPMSIARYVGNQSDRGP
jgi:hypothetical protein